MYNETQAPFSPALLPTCINDSIHRFSGQVHVHNMPVGSTLSVILHLTYINRNWRRVKIIIIVYLAELRPEELEVIISPFQSYANPNKTYLDSLSTGLGVFLASMLLGASIAFLLVIDFELRDAFTQNRDSKYLSI